MPQFVKVAPCEWAGLECCQRTLCPRPLRQINDYQLAGCCQGCEGSVGDGHSASILAPPLPRALHHHLALANNLGQLLQTQAQSHNNYVSGPCAAE